MGWLACSGVAPPCIARSSVARSGITRSGVSRSSVARSTRTRSSITSRDVPQRSVRWRSTTCSGITLSSVAWASVASSRVAIRNLVKSCLAIPRFRRRFSRGGCPSRCGGYVRLGHHFHPRARGPILIFNVIQLKNPAELFNFLGRQGAVARGRDIQFQESNLHAPQFFD